MATLLGFSTETYWNEFDLDEGDLDLIYNLLLEREVPLTSAEMAEELVEYRLKRLEREAQQASETEHEVYLPAKKYEVGQTLSFPALGNLIGTIVDVRPGENPDIGPFEVIKVELSGDDGQREFASGLENHILNKPPEPEADVDALSTVGGVLKSYHHLIEERLEERLTRAEDILNIAGRWFPKALVADINEGHLNLAEAVLDVASGGPLPTSDLLEHIELPSGVKTLLMAFSLDYALQEDERFDEVGPAGQVLWYLKRLEPPEVLYTPPRLEWEPRDVDRSLLTESLLALEDSLDDELNPLKTLEDIPGEITLSVLFPHRRVGALPLSNRLRPLFPTAYEAPRIRFNLVDGHSDEGFPGWVVREQGYVFGLDEWFERYDVPVGGLIKIRPGKQPGEVIVEAVDRRRRNDWIRTVTIDENGIIGFTMLKQAVGTAYDDLMVVGLIDPVALDEAWLGGKQRTKPADQLVAQVFRELAKLNPQSAVHAQSLYSGVNVIRRMSPAMVFFELVSRPYYLHVGDLYWRFDPSAWSSS